MKKLLLSLTMILSVMALSAQGFTVTEKETGNVVENGASYYIYGDGSEVWGEPGGEMQIEFDVTINENMRIAGRKTPTNLVEGTSTWICFGLCLAPSTGVQEIDPLPANEGDIMALSGHYIADDYMTVLGQEQHLKLEIWDAANPEDVFVINVTFKYSLDGAEEISNVESFSNAYPTPANDVVNFDYRFNEGVNSAMVAVYNMMGQEVLRSDISGMSGKLSLNVSDLADGVYFYSLVVNGKVEKSSKLVVSR